MGTRTNMRIPSPILTMTGTPSRLSPLLMVSLLVAASPVLAQDAEQPDRVQFTADLGHTRDSNYDREPGNDRESINTGTVGLRINQTLSRQRFSARAAVTRREFDEREELDTTTWAGGAGWRGAIGNRITPYLSWGYSEELVDRVEFEGKDTLTNEVFRGGVVYALGPHWDIPIRAQRVDQEHSNDSQTSLDYVDDQVSVGLLYTSDRYSTAGLNLISGQREYPNQNQARPDDIPADEDLDYDYTTVELESTWVVSPKTQLEGRLGFFDRDGEANDGSGGYALVEGRWKPTYKTKLTTGVQYTEPPIGERSNSPSEIERLYLDVEWQATTKILLSAGYAWSNNDYDATAREASRTEEVQVINPLIARYQMTDTLELYFNSTLVDRSSPLDEREFDATIFKLGLNLTL